MLSFEQVGGEKMEKPDFAVLHDQLKSGNAGEILSRLVEQLTASMLLEEVKQYFYHFNDYIIRLGSEELFPPFCSHAGLQPKRTPQEGSYSECNMC